MDQLEFTGERLVTSISGNVAKEHLHRYAFALNYVKGKKVLDIACGEGYGANLLSNSAEFVFGVDNVEEVVRYATNKYVKKNLEFKVGLAEKIPFPDRYFDVVVSFETIEHLVYQKEMIQEIHRVLDINGMLIISSPDKKFYSDSRDYKNEFHEKELYPDEFIELINSTFPHFYTYGQTTQSSSIIFPFNSDNIISKIEFWKGNYTYLDATISPVAKFIIIIASKMEIKFEKELSFFDNEEKDVRIIRNLDFEDYQRSFRYRFANFLFWPWDLIKRIF